MADEDKNKIIYGVKYRNRWETQMQAVGNMFRSCVEVDNEASGTLYRIPIMGTRSLSPIVSEDEQTPNNAQSKDVRWMAPQGFHDGECLPKNLSLYSPNGENYASKIIVECGNAAGRTCDEVIIKAALGSVRTGEDGSVFLPFPEKNIIKPTFDLVTKDNTTPLSMTFSKVLRTKTLLTESDAYKKGDKLIFAISPRCLENMLLDPRFTSADYGMIQSLITGEVKNFLGFEWMVTTELPEVNGVRQCAAWTKKAMTLGIWEDYKVELSQRADLMNRDQIYVHCHLSAARVHDGGVYRIDCKEVV